MQTERVKAGERAAASPWGRAPLQAGALLAVLGVFWVVEHRLIYANAAISEVAETDIRDAYIEQLESGELLRQVALLGFGALGLVAVVSKRGAPWNIRTTAAVPLALLLVWTAASVVWSEQPGVTAKRLVVLACVLSGSAGLARVLTPREVLTGVLLILSALVSVSLATDLALGGTPWAGGDYRFGGTLHPNAQALYLGLLCLAAYCQPIGFGRRWMLWSVFAAALGLMLLTRSRTGLVALAAALVVVGTVRLPSRVRWAGASVLVCGLAAVVVFFSSVGEGARHRAVDAVLLGRTEQAGTLTGRVPLWEELLALASHRPITGYGYEGFWTPDLIAAIMKSQNWSIQSAHNAYLDTVLELGVVGLLLSVGFLGSAALSILAAYDATREPGYAFAMGVLVFGAVNSLLESLFTDVRFPPVVALVCLFGAVFFFPGTIANERPHTAQPQP